MKTWRSLVTGLACSLLALSYNGRCAAADNDKVVIEDNITYGKAGDTELNLDLARPQGDGPFPAIVFIHGGGWSGGNRQGYRGQIQEAAKRGYVAVNRRPASLRAASPEHLARFTHGRSGKLGRIREPLPPDFRLEKSRGEPADLLPHHRERHHGERKMERPQNDSLPTLMADVDNLHKFPPPPSHRCTTRAISRPSWTKRAGCRQRQT